MTVINSILTAIGGADVKFIPACFFIFGAAKGMFGLMIGLVLSVIGTGIRNKAKKSEDKTLPLIPYLSGGFIALYLL